MRQLEIGSGGGRQHGISTDAIFFPTLDVQCVGYALPFKANVFDSIYMNGVFEHFTYPQAKQVLLECFRVLKPEGVLDFNVPDIEAFAHMLVDKLTVGWRRGWMAPPQGLKASGDIELDYILSGFYGGQDRPGMVHQSGWTERMLTAELQKAGFKDIVMYSHDHNEPGSHLSYRAGK